MFKLLKIVLVASLALGVVSTSAMADPVKGQKLFIKKLKKPCGFKGDVFATKHTQAQWQAIMKEGKMKAEIMSLCPKADGKKIKDKYIKHLFDFAYEYASDSGNVPSC